MHLGYGEMSLHGSLCSRQPGAPDQVELAKIGHAARPPGQILGMRLLQVHHPLWLLRLYFPVAYGHLLSS